MHARYHAFNIGRFMTVNPVRGTIGSSQSWNAYAYVRANPINRFDPFGMADKDKKPCKKGRREAADPRQEWEPVAPCHAGAAGSQRGAEGCERRDQGQRDVWDYGRPESP